MKKVFLLISPLFFLNIATAQVLDYQDFNLASLGWTEVHTIGTSTLYGWGPVPFNYNLTTNPIEGGYMALFGSAYVPSGNSYELRSPALAFGGNNYKVKFQMYREGSYPTHADNIKVYYNTIPGSAGGVLLGTVNRCSNLSPAVPFDDWYSYDFDLPAGVSGTGYITLLSASDKGNNIYIDTLSVEQVQDNDAQNNRLDVAPYLVNGTIPINGTLKNMGLNTITALDIHWQVDSGDIHTASLSGLTIQPGQLYTYNHPEAWVATPGSYSLRTWVSNLNNGTLDANLANDEMVKPIEVVNEIYPANIVYEVSTGSWCGWCIRTHVYLKNMEHFYPDNFIGIAVHNFNNYDPMQVNAYNSGMGGYNGGVYPNGTVGRRHIQTDPQWVESGFQSLLRKVPLGKVAIPTQSWNPTSRVLSFDAQAVFARDMTSTNYKLAAVIIEDGVTGTENGYNQSNYYYEQAIDIIDWEGINWRNLGNPIPAATIVYNRVARAVPGGFAGVAGSVPTSVAYNVPYSHTFSYTVPTTQNENNLKLIAMLVDSTTGQIVNAKEVPLDTTLGNPNFDTEKLVVYPNPTRGVLHIVTNQTVDITIIDLTGKVVFSMTGVDKETTLNLSKLGKGIYMVQLKGDTGTRSAKLIVE